MINNYPIEEIKGYLLQYKVEYALINKFVEETFLPLSVADGYQAKLLDHLYARLDKVFSADLILCEGNIQARQKIRLYSELVALVGEAKARELLAIQ